MNATPTPRTSTRATRVRRVLAVLSLAAALVAIPAISPDDASARRRSEATVNRMCSAAGGTMHYEFESSDFDDYSMHCSLSSGPGFSCFLIGGPFDNMLMCA